MLPLACTCEWAPVCCSGARGLSCTPSPGQLFSPSASQTGLQLLLLKFPGCSWLPPQLTPAPALQPCQVSRGCLALTPGHALPTSSYWQLPCASLSCLAWGDSAHCRGGPKTVQVVGVFLAWRGLCPVAPSNPLSALHPAETCRAPALPQLPVETSQPRSRSSCCWELSMGRAGRAWWQQCAPSHAAALGGARSPS